MQNKLQELTDKLYNEGLSRGRQEAGELIAEARREADEIIAQARRKAEEIEAEARKSAESIRKTAENDIALASTMTISAVRQQVENAVVARAVAQPVSRAFSDPAFVRELLATVVKAFKASETQARELDVILPDSLKSEIDASYAAELSTILGAGVEISYLKGLPGGFRIGPRDGGYRIDITEEEFSSLIGAYLRPATRKILFGL
ncbi:MAG: hypothetical protein IKO77_00075 [Bacteroidales bacterium]|nr:hypothetical protein [Bacteroidales bacterium]